MNRISRRRFVTIGVLATATGLAGCTDDDDGDAVDDGNDVDDDEEDMDEEEEETEDGDPEERLDAFLSDNDARQYDGSVEDNTGEDEVTVAVGGGDEGLAFDPPAIRIDTGTTIVWEWTGEGGGHNIAPEGETDFDDFGDEEIVDSDDRTVEDTFEEEGVGLYLCEPHAGVEMYGGFVVE